MNNPNVPIKSAVGERNEGLAPGDGQGSLLPDMNDSTILWIYIALLMAGGLTGFLKAGSKASLIASSIFALVLVACNTGWIPGAHAADVVLAILFLFFGKKFAKTRKFMPSGLMAVLSLVAIGLRFAL